MLRSRGRPRRACNTCQDQKIRCTGERPHCKRCLRLQHTCTYDAPTKTGPRPPKVTPARASTSSVARAGTDLCVPRSASRFETHKIQVPMRPLDPANNNDLGIPVSLVPALVELYFENIYHSSFLLHRELLLESIKAGTTCSHMLLSVCACGSHFYRDANGQPSLVDQGFTIEWATRAGRLVFQEAEELREENIVTFCNLAMFWYGQGSWRKSQLHKGNACHLVQIVGLKSDVMHDQDSLECEIRRRRLWACYVMECHSPEGFVVLQPCSAMQEMALPWSEEDFHAGQRKGASTSLVSGRGNGGILGELIQALTLWSLVLLATKAKDHNLAIRVAQIHTLDEKISSWWRDLRTSFKLSESEIEKMKSEEIPKIILTNIVYHQSLCALHASIIPLFSGASTENCWSSARRLSAQIAFEHAAAISELNSMILSRYHRLCSTPAFVAYAAYCSCAIQIPFTWCLDSVVREQAKSNVKANIAMIQTIGIYWKYASLLKILVHCLYDIHKANPITLGNEPKHLSIEELARFKITSEHARDSILEFHGALRSRDGGYPRPGGEHRDLSNTAVNERSTMHTEVSDIGSLQGGPTESTAINWSSQGHIQNQTTPTSPGFDTDQLRDHRGEQYRPELQSHSQLEPSPIHFQQRLNTIGNYETETDIFNPFVDADIFGLFPSSEIVDYSQFDTEMFNIDFS